jgi:hypothetical protein
MNENDFNLGDELKIKYKQYDHSLFSMMMIVTHETQRPRRIAVQYKRTVMEPNSNHCRMTKDGTCTTKARHSLDANERLLIGYSLAT